MCGRALGFVDGAKVLLVLDVSHINARWKLGWTTQSLAQGPWSRGRMLHFLFCVRETRKRDSPPTTTPLLTGSGVSCVGIFFWAEKKSPNGQFGCQNGIGNIS